MKTAREGRGEGQGILEDGFEGLNATVDTTTWISELRVES